MADHPLKHRTRYDQSPQTKRRALTPDEIRRLLDAARGWRRLVYEVALCSGLRAKELRSLRRSDLDTERGGLVLHAVWTKNRKDGFQPLPSVLVEELRAFAESGEAAQLYRGYVPRIVVYLAIVLVALLLQFWDKFINRGADVNVVEL
ncbi:MAG: tyrosine-type recombinase/integrase [Planctomycetota bacterium]